MLYEHTEPAADAMSESLRAFGYSVETSIADLLDNSIKAGAKNIHVDFNWSGPDSSVTVLDDGHGMTAEALREAMRPGSTHPQAPRETHDLGRFGLGLKTASFGQCRNLTVFSKTKSSAQAVRRWDLDYINETQEWRLLSEIDKTTEIFANKLDAHLSGTLVVWEKMDRIIATDSDSNNDKEKARFFSIARDVENHISLIFHRFMTGSGKIKMFVNGNVVKPLDPFLRSNRKTQDLGSNQIEIGGHSVTVTPYVLPHQSLQSREEQAEGALIRGWNAHQGFYIYRNKRLLVSGAWLRLYQQEEHYKLARIQVDIPNSLDELFGIDVMKATAHIPSGIRTRMKSIADEARRAAVEIYRHRGQVKSRNITGLIGDIWKLQKKSNGRTELKLDRKHPYIENFMNQASNFKKEISTLFRFVEDTVPINSIWIEKQENPEHEYHWIDSVSERDQRKLTVDAAHAFLTTGLSFKDTCEKLKQMEPTSYVPHLVDEVLAEIEASYE